LLKSPIRDSETISLNGDFKLHLATKEHVVERLKSIEDFVNMKERNGLRMDNERLLRERKILMNQLERFGR
jgi:hypothetical protein